MLSSLTDLRMFFCGTLEDLNALCRCLYMDWSYVDRSEGTGFFYLLTVLKGVGQNSAIKNQSNAFCL